MEENKILTEEEERFCLLYVNAPSPYAGNATKCYKAVFGKINEQDQDNVQASISANELLRDKRIADRIKQLEELNIINASTLRPRITQTLLKIADECAHTEYFDRYGVALSPAALRAVSVNAIRTLADIYGIKEDVAHKVAIEGAGGQGVVINVIAPQKSEQVDDVTDDNV